MFWQREEKDRQGGRKTGATINSTLVVRGERKGQRETERMERRWEVKKTDWKNETLPSPNVYRSQPQKIFFYSLLKQLKSEKQPMHVQKHSHVYIIIVINPYKRTTFTQVIFGCLNKQTHRIYRLKNKKTKKKNKRKWGSHLRERKSPTVKHTGRCSL